MTRRLPRIALSMNGGVEGAPHAHFYDVDSKTLTADELRIIAPDALIYETEHGFHIVNSYPIISPTLEMVLDPNCPRTAVRIYPNSDFRLVQEPVCLCEKLLAVYNAVLSNRWTRTDRLICAQPLKFGVYEKLDASLLGTSIVG